MAAETTEIFVYLEDEGVDVWRPTQAEHVGGQVYRLLATPDYDPDDEHWEFPPGSEVVCVKRKLDKGTVLVAVQKADVARRSA